MKIKKKKVKHHKSNSIESIASVENRGNYEICFFKNDLSIRELVKSSKTKLKSYRCIDKSKTKLEFECSKCGCVVTIETDKKNEMRFYENKKRCKECVFSRKEFAVEPIKKPIKVTFLHKGVSIPQKTKIVQLPNVIKRREEVEEEVIEVKKRKRSKNIILD